MFGGTGSGSGSSEHAVSAFDKVVAVLKRDSDVIGTDSTVSPLAHDELRGILDHRDFARMQELIRDSFTSGSGEALSERDVSNLARKAMQRLGGRGAGAAATAGAGAAAPGGMHFRSVNPDRVALADTSTKSDLAAAFLAVRDLTYEQLMARYTLEGSHVWYAGKKRILIRDHYPALFRSMCKSANVHTIGDNTAWELPSFTGGHALLRGTAGTGKSTFMFVMFIEFLKMLRAPAHKGVVEVDGVVVFNPAVASIRIQWDGVYGGESIVLGESHDYESRVVLFDAGNDNPVKQLPGSQGVGYFLATSSANPEHYKAWDSKQVNLKKQYSVLWSVGELQRLIDVLGLAGQISAEQVHDRYAVVGGVPRLILHEDASQLLKIVKARVKDITIEMVRTVIQDRVWSREGLLHSGTGTQSFSMFAMDVKAKDDFDDVQVKFLTRTVQTEFFAQASAKTASDVAYELSVAVKTGRGHTRSDSFEDLALLKLSRDGFRGDITVLVPEGADRVAEMVLPPSLARSFVNAKHLARLVETDVMNGEFRIYIPMGDNNPLVDAWCTCTVDEKWAVVGLQMTIAKLAHPVSGEDVAKAQFNAIHGAFATHGVAVDKAAWVVFVLPSAHYPDFPYQHAKARPGEQKKQPAGLIWAHTQAKLGMRLDAGGTSPADMGSYCDSDAHVTTVKLSADVTSRDLCKLYNIGPKYASRLLSVLRDKTREESKTVEDFLKSLDNGHKALANVLKHRNNQGKWAYLGQVWSRSAPAPTPASAPAGPAPASGSGSAPTPPPPTGAGGARANPPTPALRAAGPAPARDDRAQAQGAAAGAGAGARTVAAQQKRKTVDGRTHRRSKRARRGGYGPR